jgi:biotin transport system substrate-specific component
MVLYVLAGAIGLPVYADGDAGLARLLGFTGGYLVGFIVAAALVGRLAEQRWDRSIPRAAGLMLVGTFVIYALGVPVLAMVADMPVASAIEAGALVFVPWDLAKIALAAVALPLAWRLAGPRT